MKTTEKYPTRWKHWIIERCADPKCVRTGQGQMPVIETYGEDCELFEKLGQMRSTNRSVKCECGEPIILTYRHAMADWPEVVDFWKKQDAGLIEAE